MNVYELITKKKRGEALTDEEISYLINGYTNGSIPDYQMSAFLMAVCFRGMSDKELADFTLAMASSGDTVDLSRFGTLSVDKHSTGGVGDKTTLIIAPIVASLGGRVAKMSGRGLGHTGGTVDKLESFPGFNTSLSVERFFEQVEKIGIAVTGQTGSLAPADKKLYALRDVTATVDSIPLIASSIMSKKLASGSHSIVLDVKCGSGAFMKTEDDARRLAENMVSIGKSCGRRICALITNMDLPLGFTVGNILEVKEAIEVLRGGGPSDLREVSVALATEMVALSLELPREKARENVLQAIQSGAALSKMKEWIAMQGGDASYVDNPELFPEATRKIPVKALADGYISAMNAEEIGNVASALGAGRTVKDAKIDYTAGIVLEKKTGDYVKRGELLCTLHTCLELDTEQISKKYLSALTFSSEPQKKPKAVYSIIDYHPKKV